MSIPLIGGFQGIHVSPGSTPRPPRLFNWKLSFKHQINYCYLGSLVQLDKPPFVNPGLQLRLILPGWKHHVFQGIEGQDRELSHQLGFWAMVFWEIDRNGRINQPRLRFCYVLLANGWLFFANEDDWIWLGFRQTWVKSGVYTPGWWFGCHFWHFPINIGNFIIPIDEV